MWVLTAPAPNAHTVGTSLCSDLRSDVSRNPFVFQLTANTILNRYNITTKSWSLFANPTLGGVFGIGSTSIFTPSRGLEGLISAGSTNLRINTSTIMFAIGVNMLANRGGSGEYGFKIRIVGLVSGKTEERFVVANSGSTTPSFTLDSPLTFIPAVNDRYEIIAGRLFMLGAGTIAATSFRSMEVSTNFISNGGTVGLPAIGIDSNIIALDEQYTPFYTEPGEGFIKGAFLYDNNLTQRYALVATGVSINTITGQLVDGDNSVLANEYRNFQIRIVQDEINPSAVGQRRIINSHTQGPSSVYTLGTSWTVTPSSSAKYVIEYPNLLMLRTSGSALVFTYNYSLETINNGVNSILANSWSTTYFATAPAINAVGGMQMPAYGMRPDPEKYARHSHIFTLRGGNTSNMDLFDISGAINGLWTPLIIYDGGVLVSTGSCGAPAPYKNDGRFYYMNVYVTGVINQIFRFDTKNRVLSPYTPTDWIQAGTATVGNRMTTFAAFDGTDKYDVIFLLTFGSTITQELIVQV